MGMARRMEWAIVLVLGAVLVAAVGYSVARGRQRSAAALRDARAEAQRWYERLGGQLDNLPPSDSPAVRQALVDAGERYTAAGSQLSRAGTVREYQLARETALEGLAYLRAARIALGLDPGPELPPLAAQRAAGEITKERAVDVQGHRYAAGPRYGEQTPYYHPGGMVAGRPVPRGWYSEPWWRTALVGGAWGLGTALLFGALFSPMWGDPGYDPGIADAGATDQEVTGDELAGDGADAADAGDTGDTGEAGAEYADDYGGGDYGGDLGGGDFGGGDFGGDFGGGDF